MKLDRYLHIKDSQSWVRITYKTSVSTGEMLMKYEYYMDVYKRVAKRLKGCEWVCELDYHITMMDICKSALRIARNRFQFNEYKLKCERNRMYPNQDYEDNYMMEMKRYHSIIVRLQKMKGITIWKNIN